MKYARELLSEKKRFSVPSDLKLLIVKSETVCGSCISNLEGYDHDANSVSENTFIFFAV